MLRTNEDLVFMFLQGPTSAVLVVAAVLRLCKFEPTEADKSPSYRSNLNYCYRLIVKNDRLNF